MKKVLFTLLILLLMLHTSLAQTNGSFLFDGINRSYIVYVPQERSGSAPFPLMIVLHGFTQTGQTIMNYSDFNTYAELYGFVAVYPNGVGNSWNVGVGGGSTANDVGFLSALIDTLNQQIGIDLNRVYACGFSNGGFMSYRLACELSDRIAAIGNSGIGNTNQDIIASKEIWKFVSRFNLDGLTGLQQTGDQNHQLQLFPNPATDGKTLVTLPAGKESANIHLTNLQGLSLKEWTVELRHETIELSLHGLKSGVYILHVQSGRQRFVEKLMILN
jgi:pimeloyl-ACP methyl ester carboxylesterase